MPTFPTATIKSLTK